MPWFKVDDGLTGNKKVLRIPRNRRCGAVGLWLLAGTWSSANLTDGSIPDYVVAELGGTPAQVRDLVAVGLWTKEGDDYRFGNWSEYQPTRADVEQKRDEHAAKMREWREAKKSKRDQRDGDVTRHAGVTNESVTRHEVVSDDHVTSFPTRPDPTPISVVTSAAAVTNGDAREAPADLEAEAGRVERTLAEFDAWCDQHHKPRPTEAAKEILGRHISAHLAQGIEMNHIRIALTRWKAKALGPAAFPGFIDEARNTPTAKPRRQADTDDIFDKAASWAAEQDRKAIAR